MRLTTRTIMVATAVVALNLAAFRVLTTLPFEAGYHGILPLALFQLGLFRCWHTRGRDNAFWRTVLVVDLVLAAHQLAALATLWRTYQIPGSWAWQWWAFAAGTIWDTVLSWAGVERDAVYPVSCLFILTACFLPVATAAWVAGLVRLRGFDLWARRRGASAAGPASAVTTSSGAEMGAAAENGR